MTKQTPRVSIGLPVYNGERYIAAALDSILAQSFKDFDVIVCDNASTDRTEEICRAYAARDSRIRYFRNDEDLGAARNFNRVFELSRGDYFKWAAHDDVLASTYLERCVQTLDRAPDSVVLCLPRTKVIDAWGKVSTYLDFVENARVVQADRGVRELRFREAVRIGPGGAAQVAFGLMRSAALRRTRLMGAHRSADWVFAAEMSLYGEIWQIPPYLFFLRIYGQHDARRNRSDRDEARWWDTSNGPHVLRLREAKLLLEHVRAIRRCELGRGGKALRLIELAGAVRCWLWRRLRYSIGRARYRIWCRTVWVSNRTLLPLRIWTFVRSIRRSHSWRVDRAVREAWHLADADLLFTAARALAGRCDPSREQTVGAWLEDATLVDAKDRCGVLRNDPAPAGALRVTSDSGHPAVRPFADRLGAHPAQGGGGRGLIRQHSGKNQGR